MELDVEHDELDFELELLDDWEIRDEEVELEEKLLEAKHDLETEEEQQHDDVDMQELEDDDDDMDELDEIKDEEEHILLLLLILLW